MTQEIQVYYTAGAWHWRQKNLLTATILSSAGPFTSAPAARAAALIVHPTLTATPFYVADTRRYPVGW